MTDTALPEQDLPRRLAERALRASGVFWFSVAMVGQAAFVLYIVLFYGRSGLAGDYARWNDVLVGGWRTGDMVGNATLALHLLLAAVITVGGPLQLIPAVRRRWPMFHRWNGRTYMVAAMLASLGGLYLAWTRDLAGEVAMQVGISLNGVLIVVCAVMAWRLALAKRFDEHRRWALRTFVLVSGVWFFRVGLMAWLLANRGPVGIGEDFDGPYVRFLAYGCYLVPLAVLELYFRAQRAGPAARVATAAVVGVLTLVMALGILGAAMGMWLPRVT
ncbi:MAG: DUF2306 domain-containing protein [Caulobacter sp.]|nr:DUF2306 domain-containing protein [Caulobacter sp.]